MADYQKKKKEIQAVKLVKPVYDKHGDELAKKGDWLVIEGTRQYYMSDDEFTEEFELKSPDGVVHYYPVPYPYYIPTPVIVYPQVIPPTYPQPYWQHYEVICGSPTTSGTTSTNVISNIAGITNVECSDCNSSWSESPEMISSNVMFGDCSYVGRIQPS